MGWEIGKGEVRQSRVTRQGKEGNMSIVGYGKRKIARAAGCGAVIDDRASVRR